MLNKKKSRFCRFAGIILLLLSANLSLAGTSNRGTADELASIRDKVISSVGNPAMVKNNVKGGSVWVTFSINEKREIIIENVVGNSQYLNDFVKSELEGASFDLSRVDTNQLYRIRVNFELI